MSLTRAPLAATIDPVTAPPEPMDLDAALARASEENDLPTYYRACVRPLLKMDPSRWPACCGANCDPCTDQLVRVARRVNALLGR